MKKKLLLIIPILLLIVAYFLFGASLGQKTYYVKENEKVELITKPKFFSAFIKAKKYSKKGKYKEKAYCGFKKLQYEVHVLSFDESEMVIGKGDKYSPDCSGLTNQAKLSSDVPIEDLSKHPGIHLLKVNDHNVLFEKKIVILGFEKDVLFMKRGEKQKIDNQISGTWESQGDAVTINENGEVEAVKEGESTVTLSYQGKKAALKIQVIDMKDFYWLSLGESITLPNEEGEFSAGDLIKTDKNKAKAIKCGKEEYSYSIGDLLFKGTVLVSDFPKEKAVLVGEEFAQEGLVLSSSDTDIAEIKENKVFAKKEGTCDITAEYEKEKRICKLTIFSIHPENILGNAGEKISLSKIKGLKYSSENPEIASVKDGEVTLVSGGCTNILYSLSGTKGKIPVYSSSYENGDATGKVIKTGEDGIVHTMTVWCQHARNYSKYNTFLAGNGSSLCSLTCILNGYAKGYEDMTPPEVMDSLEREVVGDSRWLSHHHDGRDGRAMPMSMYGVNSCLNHAGVESEYIPSFDRDSMKEDITQHLKTGQPVVIEVSKTNQVTGQSDHYWSGSVHTVILVGFDGDKVIVADPANISRGSGRGRIKRTDLDFITQYMWSCSRQPDNLYWSGKSVGGGYIKVYSTPKE